MTLSNDTLDKLQQNIVDALINVGRIVEEGSGNPADLLPMLNLFLLTVISTAADMAEVVVPGGGAYIYADVEAGARQRGLHSISRAMEVNGYPNYSVSDIKENDMSTAMNYLGQQLTITLMKGMHELPKPLRGPEIQLRGIEALISNLLHSKFDDPYEVLSDFCDHVRTCLADLASCKPPYSNDNEQSRS